MGKWVGEGSSPGPVASAMLVTSLELEAEELGILVALLSTFSINLVDEQNILFHP